ncbi:predicted protein [Postia placenta Mad-698-R]|uniref:Uncharacterized protein n=1 Tax=Postia placenta MAD-698-R-SB12 TaxID=670580 RepID=A0A1X6MML7_9APHY|nr:hypothetical protein POSPLADRAFT_1049811 [Postia placenta MAD-698-R-SB12]EED80121.1 predicted protein [Postia placenta Mad-698-R]OSX57568.1 hypothetical protein POSPLADRAFT_1049811 [Postia placenta MAD-698-R-SB12]
MPSPVLYSPKPSPTPTLVNIPVTPQQLAYDYRTSSSATSLSPTLVAIPPQASAAMSTDEDSAEAIPQSGDSIYLPPPATAMRPSPLQTADVAEGTPIVFDTLIALLIIPFVVAACFLVLLVFIGAAVLLVAVMVVIAVVDWVGAALTCALSYRGSRVVQLSLHTCVGAAWSPASAVLAHAILSRIPLESSATAAVGVGHTSAAGGALLGAVFGIYTPFGRSKEEPAPARLRSEWLYSVLCFIGIFGQVLGVVLLRWREPSILDEFGTSIFGKLLVYKY